MCYHITILYLVCVILLYSILYELLYYYTVCYNIQQAAMHYCVRMGFTPFLYRGLETGSRETACHVVKSNQVLVYISYIL